MYVFQPNPLLSLEPGAGYLFSVCWSVSNPLVFTVGTGDGQVLFYDIKVSNFFFFFGGGGILGVF